ncbi:MAG: efflux RND transporter periplasmic adaptor subunit [Roseburia sp.]|nr:efflux RND transporter periplasmic adaptor subunit [Roseburia sp.]
MKKKRICLLAGIMAAGILAAGSIVWAKQSKSDDETEAVYKEVIVEKGNLTVGISESGSVAIGTLTQEFELESDTDSSTAGSVQTTSGGQSGGASVSGSTAGSSASSSSESLVVEELYVAVGQTVKEGEPLLKISAESAAEYREALSDAVTEAEAAVNEAGLSAEKQKLSASYSYQLSTAEGSVAGETYQATLKELQDAVDEAQEAVDASASLLNYYQEQIDAGVDLSASLAEEQVNYDKLCTKLQSAKNSYTTKSIEAEKAYQEAVLSAQNASSQYSVDVSGADNDVDDARDALAEAEAALEEFDAAIGEDGIIYAAYGGTITSLGCEEGDTLTTGDAVATFADDTAVTITVSVSEEDITEIALGDEAEIELTAYEDRSFTGTVDSIDTSASSGSSTVSYSVTVVVTDDVSGIYADMTGNVTFVQKRAADVLYVSNKAVQTEGTTSYVKVKDDDGTVRRVDVVTGFSDGVNVEIVSGLSEGETVLVEGQAKQS